MLLFRSRFPGLFTFIPAWFPVPSFRFCVLSYLSVSFHPTLLRSHSCSTGSRFVSVPLSVPFSFAFSVSLPLPFVRFRFSISLLSLLFFLFHFSSRSCLTAGFFGAPVPLSLSRSFPLFSGLVSRAFLPVLCTWLSVCFLSLLPASLPRLFHWCSPCALLCFLRFAFGAFPFFSASFRPLLFRFSLLGFGFFLFPASLFSLARVFQVLPYPLSLPPVAMLPFLLWYSAFLHFFSPLFCFASQVLLQSPTSCFQLGRSPLLSL